MPNRGRTIVYFDNSNIFHGQKVVGWRIDAEKLMDELGKAGEVWQTYFFAAVTEPPRYTQTSFYRMLKEKLRWEMTILPLGKKSYLCKSCGNTWTAWAEKGVDVAIANKMLTHGMNKAFDTAILVSGDKDFVETVRAVKNMGLRVEIVSFSRSLSIDLANESSTPVVILDELQDNIELSTPDEEAEELQEIEETTL